MQISLKKNWKSKTDQWIDERFPKSRQVTLNLKRIFVFPSLSSLALLLTIMLLFVMGVNFQNSLAYGLCFWLLALIVISIFFTYRNLSAVTIKAIKSQHCFAGEKAVFELNLHCPADQKKSAIYIGWKNQDIALVNLNDKHSDNIKLSHSTHKRGVFTPEKLTIFTRYPVGLITAWSYAQLELKSIVYPAPILHKENHKGHAMHDEAEEGLEIARGTTDFSGVKTYQAGDSPKHIHWGSYAKTGKVYSKTFVDYANHDLWLDFEALSAIKGTETKLSHLCALVLQYQQEQQTYGLKLPTKVIQPATGEAHKTQCLEALALFGEPKSADNVVTDNVVTKGAH